MTQEQYYKSIETGYLQLSFWHKVTHYGIVGFCFFIPLFLLAIHLLGILTGSSASFRDGETYIIIVPAILGGLFYWLQVSRLKFKVLTTDADKDEVLKYLQLLCKEWDWIPTTHNHQIFIAKTKQGFFSGSWGEQVTILFDGNRVLINSICDPNKHSSLTSMGHNWENVDAVVDLINKINQSFVKT